MASLRHQATGIILITALLALNLGAQSLTITTPDGGEEWTVGDKHPIHWNWSGSILNVKIEYSTDGGTNWLLIASSTLNDGSYPWTIPNTSSTNCFIRISDVTEPLVNDLSDGSFSIVRSSLIIKKPAGGDSLRVGEYHPIHWDWTGKFTSAKLEYSIDGGSSWSTIIASTPNDGNHYWQIPNAPSDDCYIKITNLADPECYTVLEHAFAIAVSTIDVIGPDGGETFTTGQIHPIYWDWTGSFGSVKIEYSTDGGGSWDNIMVSTQNDGSHYWAIPNTPSDNCEVKITNTTDPNCFDISDAYFIIQSTGLQLLTPDGGETYAVGDLCPIHWDWSGTITSVRLEYSTDEATTWNTIIASTPNDGDYVWTVQDCPSNQCRIRMTNVADPDCQDASNMNFTIEEPWFRLINPDSGKGLVVGEVYPIHWNWRGAVSSIKLELAYRTETGVNWWTITTSTLNDGSHYFTVPNYVSDSCWIKITSATDPLCHNLGEVFSIVHPQINVVYPNGGESFVEGEIREIVWDWNGSFSNVMIQYSIDNGTNWTTITLSTTNKGSYKWTVPNRYSTNCLVKVINTEDIESYDISNNNFTIERPAIPIIRPKLSDIYYTEHKYPIYWRWTGGFPSVKIDYSLDGGPWKNIVLSTPNTGYYLWTCDTLSSANARIRMIDSEDPAAIGYSELFTIADDSILTESVSVFAPIASDSLIVGGDYYITWHSVCFDPNYVNLYYSIDGGGSFHFIYCASNTGKFYKWTVPNDISDNCLIKIEDVNQTIEDISETFSIVPQEIDIVSPINMDEWIVGRKHYILWKSTGEFSNAIIEYSYNGGTDWVNIATSTLNDGEHEWTIPNTPTANCLVRVKNYENEGVYAVSDTFTLMPQTITVTYPIESDSLIVGRKYYVTWDYTGNFSSVNIEYSIDGGENWTPIASWVSNNQRYEWTVPNAPDEPVIVKVINSANPGVFGESDTLSVVPQMIEITSPESSDEWIVGRKYYITWWYTGEFPHVKIEYSYDGGITWNTIVENAPNSRNHEWTIPDTPSDTCLIRVTNRDNLNVSGLSPTYRIPLQAVTITSPEAGNNLISGRKCYVTWISQGSFSDVDIEYSTNNGDDWNYIETTMNDGCYEWSLPVTYSDSCLVKLTNPQDPNVTDMSDLFSILPPGITVTSPTFPDTLVTGRKYYLTWRTKGEFSNVDIHYSLDGGLSWEMIRDDAINSGYCEWQLPEIPSPGLIRILNSAQPQVFAVSDTFVLSQPALMITSPLPGDVWFNTRKYYVTWNCAKGIEAVNLFYYDGDDWNSIVENTPNQGSYEWTIPHEISLEDCRIRLVSSANVAISYESEPFMVAFTGVEEYSLNRLPDEYALKGFYPNPFLAKGHLRLSLPVKSRVSLKVYDVCGRLSHEIFEGDMEAGYHVVPWNGIDTKGQRFPRGIYFIRLEAKGEENKIFESTVKVLKM